MKTFDVVDMQIARNPIARAIANKRLESAIKSFLTRIYLLQDGEYCESDATAAMQVMAVLCECLKLSGKWEESAVIRGGMSCLVQIAQRGFTWRTGDAPALDAALTKCVSLYPKQPAKLMQRAWANVMRTDRAIREEVAV